MSMPKNYQPEVYAQDLQKLWKQTSRKVKDGAKSFAIALPPPNITGSLHMGHGFQITLMDIMIRHAHLTGCNAYWQIGTDHAGIATQMVVERQLGAQGRKRQDMTRNEFLDEVMAWKEQSGGNIIRQMQGLGLACNWESERFTMDPDYCEAVTKAFVTLYRDKKIYRGKKLVNWDPVFKTAISDLEVINSEEEGSMWHITYANTDAAKPDVTVATTRPETMFGDVAIAIHPDSPQAAELIGSMVIIPVSNRKIPVIADHDVDPEFGTGCVKITPAHDFNDYRIGMRHNLTPINILNPDASLNDSDAVPANYRGLDRFVAREQLVAELTKLGSLAKTDPHTLKVPRGDRSNSVIEPYLTDQWFVDTQEMGKEALAVAESGELEFSPANWLSTYRSWLTNLDDWCISRQLWWGHQIPAWYAEGGEIYVGYSEQEVRSHYGLAADIKLTQDADVLDTWFSSALWPFASLGWPQDNSKLDEFYPTSQLVTGFDILFFWVARMVMFGLYFQRQLPFKKVIITGLIRDAHGHKMSKSKGNVIDPIDLINGIKLEDLVAKRQHGLMQPQMQQQIERQTKDDYPEGFSASGADAVRFCFAALASPGRDIKFDYGRLQGYRNFTNKLWNATRFLLMHADNITPNQDLGPIQASDLASGLHAWMADNLRILATTVSRHIGQARFDLLTQSLHELGWHEFCDWYLELSKFELMQDNAEIQRRCLRAMIANLVDYLRLLHPVMPYLTEVLWAELRPLTNSDAPISISCHSINHLLDATQSLDSQDASSTQPFNGEFSWLKDVITQIRTIRTQFNLKPSAKTPLVLKSSNVADHNYWDKYADLIQYITKISDVTWIKDAQTPLEKKPYGQAILPGGLIIALPIAPEELAQEKERIQRKIASLTNDLTKIEAKLANENFVKNAPDHVVTEQRTKQHEFQNSLEGYQEQLESLSAT